MRRKEETGIDRMEAGVSGEGRKLDNEGRGKEGEEGKTNGVSGGEKTITREQRR